MALRAVKGGGTLLKDEALSRSLLSWFVGEMTDTWKEEGPLEHMKAGMRARLRRDWLSFDREMGAQVIAAREGACGVRCQMPRGETTLSVSHHHLGPLLIIRSRH